MGWRVGYLCYGFYGFDGFDIVGVLCLCLFWEIEFLVCGSFVDVCNFEFSK